MKNYVLETKGLTKTYKNAYALRDVSVKLETGRIYGLIGQNGAGKTTLMRTIAGLSYPTSGSLRLFGRESERQLQRERKRLGCLIELPSINPNMTARENMKLHRIMKGIPGAAVETELLALTGIADTGKKKAGNFSQGMKQRLGIAIALIGKPELLILDEPVNGLDPVGIVEVRELVKRLCDERGITVLISSHNLPELYQTATDYLIIHKGEIKDSISQAELDEKCKRYLSISGGAPETIAVTLETRLNTRNYKVMPDKSVILYDYLDERGKVGKALFDAGIALTDYSAGGDSLENYFLHVTGGDLNV